MSLFSAVANFLKPAPPPDPQLVDALARVAGRVDPMLRAASHFDHRLATPLTHALGYCAGLVDALPGPIAVDRQSFASDPLVHALFATADDINQMLGRSQAVRDFLSSPASCQADHFHALLVARHQEKQQLGMKRRGDLIENDVPQRVLFFSNQTLIAPQCDLGDLRERLRGMALESLLQTFQAHLDALRHERDDLRADASVERTYLTVLHATSGREIEGCTRHLAELDARLRQIADTLMPDPLLDALGDFLLKPEPALRLTPFSISVDRLGVVRDPTDDASVQTLHFPELSTRDQRLHLAMLVRISRAEALEAVETMRDQQRRFMLI
ncbi:hypothetical protein [Azonexus sp.]|uniref:hypothetical protein n=1 Tax=Azonexus sp. TaxID=1872668 RepID=UPI002834F438|nr:hypothetical protein [Azonexus sp.]MDR1995450.1 hypothetical protein [Azonexus sp.]